MLRFDVHLRHKFGNLKSYTTIVIGGGPAGMAAAIFTSGGSILLLERNESPGRKLLIAGAGRCNITHAGGIDNFIDRYGKNGKFLKKALREFSNEQTIKFFSDRGVATIIDKNGKVFPQSDNSRDVLNVLLAECRKKNVCISVNQQVLSIEHVSDGFKLKTGSNVYCCEHLVIATGGRSYPATGSTGDGYSFAIGLGHVVVAPHPSLTPVFVKDYPFEELAGVSLEGLLVYLYRNNRKIADHRGDIGFTHKGISGPGIIDFSRDMQEGDMLKLNFVDMPVDMFRKHFIDEVSKNGKQTIQTFLRDFDLPKRLMRALLERCGVAASDCLSNITAAKRNMLVELFCEYPCEVERLGGFKVAMATAGGVCLSEVSSKTMESKLCKNLYFAGEVLDIDGDTGGYNIQAAFSTGYMAGKAITGKLLESDTGCSNEG